MNLFWDENYNTQALALLDENFLATLSEQKERDIYARIISLDINENPIDQIEGRVTSGSINIDGNSAIRRTCSLSMITDKVDINEFYWGIKTKFKLEGFRKVILQCLDLILLFLQIIVLFHSLEKIKCVY